jgi:hypothetical protein
MWVIVGNDTETQTSECLNPDRSQAARYDAGSRQSARVTHFSTFCQLLQLA